MMERQTAAGLIETIRRMESDMDRLTALMQQIADRNEYRIIHNSAGEILSQLNAIMMKAVNQYPELDPDL